MFKYVMEECVCKGEQNPRLVHVGKTSLLMLHYWYSQVCLFGSILGRLYIPVSSLTCLFCSLCYMLCFLNVFVALLSLSTLLHQSSNECNHRRSLSARAHTIQASPRSTPCPTQTHPWPSADNPASTQSSTGPSSEGYYYAE